MDLLFMQLWTCKSKIEKQDKKPIKARLMKIPRFEDDWSIKWMYEWDLKQAGQKTPSPFLFSLLLTSHIQQLASVCFTPVFFLFSVGCNQRKRGLCTVKTPPPCLLLLSVLLLDLLPLGLPRPVSLLRLSMLRGSERMMINHPFMWKSIFGDFYITAPPWFSSLPLTSLLLCEKHPNWSYCIFLFLNK